jgi:hypothetical protein
MSLDLDKMRELILDRFDEWRTAHGDVIMGGDGIVFHLDKDLTAKLILKDDELKARYSCDPEKIRRRAKNDFEIGLFAYEGGLAIPRPYHLFETETLYPDLELKVGQEFIPTYILVMERLGKEWRPIPNLSRLPHQAGPTRRKQGALNSKHLGFARKRYYEELMKAHDLGIIVRDNGLFNNALYSLRRKEIRLLDWSRWKKGTAEELEKFRKKIDLRYRLF